MTAMIRGSIPTHEHSSPLGELSEIGEKAHRIRPVPFAGFPHRRLARQEIERPIVGLTITNSINGNHDPFASRSPHIAARVSPQEMTCIHQQHDAPFEDEGRGFYGHVFLIVVRAFETFCGSAFGCSSWDFFQDIRPSSNNRS